MSKKKIDLSDIKTNDLNETSSFTDLMSKKEINKRNSDDIDDMVNEKRKPSELEEKFNEAKEEYKKSLENTQIMELTRQMKFNFEEKKEENKKKRKHGISPLNIVGELNLFCIGYYIYLLAFTNYQDIESRYMLNGGIIILLTLLFGLSVVTPKKVSNFFYVINILTIFGFIFYNTYTLIV